MSLRSIAWPSRANWKGYLQLSLVSCSIALYPASSLSEKVSFNQINRKTGHRLKQQNIDSETGEVVSREERRTGMRLQKASTSLLKTKKSMPSRSKARGQLKSINSFCEVRSMTGISTHLTISPPVARLDRMPSRSFVTPLPK
jgi:non-homologous end joining protein Ku